MSTKRVVIIAVIVGVLIGVAGIIFDVIEWRREERAKGTDTELDRILAQLEDVDPNDVEVRYPYRINEEDAS